MTTQTSRLPNALLPALASAAMLIASCTAAVSPNRSVRPEPASATATLADAASLGPAMSELLLDSGTTISGEPVTYPSSAPAQIVAQIVTLRPGQTTGWHRHGVPTFGYILSGQIDVEYAGQGRRTLQAGDSLMEAMQTVHNGANTSSGDVRILVAYLGANGEPRTMNNVAPDMPRELSAGRQADLVELAEIDSQLKLDLRYATPENFTGRTVYPAARAFLQRPAAEALRRASRRVRDEGYGLLVLDAYRPWSVTRLFWDSYPTHRAYLADPLKGSRHNRGCAVDVTLFDPASGKEIRMPSGYDDFSERAHPSYTGGSREETEARDHLRSIMEAEGFTVYENEWWHFDYEGWRDYAVLDLPIEAPAPTPGTAASD